MEINLNHITEAEAMLIKGKTFDADRKAFICNLTTCDLLAVPGSGKTTALMAKLYALSNLLPFEDGSGILVLAHTNASVNEIEHKLKKLCPNLFEYPNFVGTVQSFVNKFLASPANANKYGSYISKNDDDIYEREVSKFFHSLAWKKTNESEQKLKNQIYRRANYGRDNISTKEKVENTIKFISYLKLDFINRKLLFGENNSTLFKFGGQAQNYYLEIELWKERLLKNGILSYKDSFCLAEWYLNKYPTIKEQLMKRFKYVFVDEMQDLENYQIQLIDNIFDKGNSSTVLQRIGDINQSIYSSSKKVKIECDWKTRNELYLTGSNRLTRLNAEIVNCFTLDNKDGKFIVEGKRELPKGDIPPHLVLFTDDTKDLLKSRFEQLIQEYNLSETEEAKNGFKIIGWTGERENEGDGKLCLHTIFGFTKVSKSKKEDFDTLGKHVQLFSKERKTLEAVRKSMLNAFITILRLENRMLEKNIKGNKVGRFYTKSDLIEFVKSHKDEEIESESYEVFKEKLFHWCFNLVTKQEYKKIYCEVANFINSDLKKWFNLSLTGKEVADFIETEFILVENNLAYSILNSVVSNDLKIEIATIHSVKGQTHCATMYVETAYKAPTYEIQKLKEESKTKTLQKKESKTNPLFKQSHTCDGAYAKQALKMMYVGFSRPTHLLCFAVLKEHVEIDIEKFRSSGWKISDLTASN